MVNTDGVINIRERLGEELERRGISKKYLSTKEIEREMERIISRINFDISKGANNIIKLISKIQIIGEDNDEITKLLLLGRSSEEIHEMDEFKTYPIDKIKEIETKKMSAILGAKLMPTDKIAEMSGIGRSGVYYAINHTKIDGITIMEIRKEKEAEVKRRIEAGESTESILSDRELNVCSEAVESILNSKKREKKYSSKDVTRQFLEGRTIDEIHQIKEFHDIPIKELEKLQQRKMSSILAIKLMPISEIVDRLGINRTSIYITLKKNKIDEKTIIEIRKEKEAEIKRRLEAGESVENILQDKKLNVCIEGIEYVRTKMISKPRDKKLSEENKIKGEKKAKIINLLVIEGSTPEEISEMEEFKDYNIENIKRLQEKNMSRILAVQLMPNSEISKRLNIQIQSVRASLRNFKSDISIAEVIQEKKSEVEKRLRAGESVENLLQDRKLNVCMEGIIPIQRKIEAENLKKQRAYRINLSNENMNQIISLLLQGNTPEEIHQLQEFAMLDIKDIKAIQDKNIARILAVQLVPMHKIQEITGLKHMQSIYENLRRYKYDGKTILEIRKEKEEYIRKRLEAGENAEQILQDERGLSSDGVREIEEQFHKEQEKARQIKVTESDANKISELILSGKSYEEIQSMEQFKKYSIEKIKESQTSNSSVCKFMAMQLVPIETIAERLGIKVATVYSNIRTIKINGKTILEIQEEKTREVKRRIENGESIEEILQDKELNVSEEGIKNAIKKSRSNLQVDRQIIILTSQGKTIEEIQSMKEFKEVSSKQIKQIQDSNMDRILALRLYSNKRIAEILGEDAKLIASRISTYKIDGKSISKLRDKKSDEVVKRLEAGETIKDLLQDKNLNIGEDFVNLPRVRIYLRERKKVEEKKLKEEKSEKQTKEKAEKELKGKMKKRSFKKGIAMLLINGKTPEEIKNMEEYKDVPDSLITMIQDSNMDRILAMRLIPHTDIVGQLGKSSSTVYRNIRNYDYDGKTFDEIKAQKLNEIATRLAQGENIDSIIADRELNVSREAVEAVQAKQKKAKKEENKSKKPTGKTEEREKTAETEKVETAKIVETAEANNKHVSEVAKTDTEQKKKLQEEKRKQSEPKREEKKNSREKVVKASNKPKTKLDIMRAKYREKYEASIVTNSSKKAPIELTQEESEKVNEALLTMTEAVNSCDGEKDSSKNMTKIILKNADKVFKKNISLAQAKQLADLLESEKITSSLQFFAAQNIPEISRKIRWIKRSSLNRLADCIEHEMNNINDLEQLEALSKLLNFDMEKESLHVMTVKSSIKRKIEKIKTEEREKRIREDIPEDIREIISGLAKGEVDIARAKNKIAEMAKAKVASRKATKFTLNEEQEIRQYIAQIRGALNKQATRFPIEDPKKTIDLLEQLTDDHSSTNLHTVITNQLSRKKFDEAQELCQEYINKARGNQEEVAYLFNLRKRIRNSKIGDIVFRTIHSDISPEDEEKFWTLIEDGLSMGNVKMSNISVGKSRDGYRTITLQDIWPEDEKGIKK